MSRPDVVRFTRGSSAQLFRVTRPEVLAVLESAFALAWGWQVEFRGTRTRLLAAGVAAPEMFQHLPGSGRRCAFSVTGDYYCLQRSPEGCFALTLYLYQEPQCGDPAQQAVRESRWWREHGPEVDAEVARALARMREHRRPDRLRRG